MPKNVTMQQIAESLGITKASVSRALSGRAGVSEALRDQVRARAVALNYQPCFHREAEPVRRFAYIVPQRFFLKEDRFYSVIHRHLEVLCTNDGATLDIHILSPEEEIGACVPASLREGGFDGFFYAGELAGEFITALSPAGKPAVLIDFRSPRLPYSAVVADNYYLGYLAASYLIERGHTAIGFAGSYDRLANIADRYMGYRRALQENGLPHRPENDIPLLHDGAILTLDFALPRPLPTAFICRCDVVAHYLVEKLRMEGLAVPRDVSIISFDNTGVARAMKPALTSAHIDKKGFASLAYASMLRQIKKPALKQEIRYVDTALVERESVRRLQD